MKLFEYEAKEIASKHGIPVPHGRLACSPEEAREAAKAIGKPVAIKSQVLVGRRGLAGGIKFADTPEETERVARELIGSSIRGVKVECVLVEEKACIDKEYYLSMTVDRSSRKPVLLVSTMGGVEVEELVREHPEALLKIHIDPWTGVKPFMARWICSKLGLGKEYWSRIWVFLEGMWRIMREYDAELVEFNPLVKTCDGELVALDAKIIVDDNSLYRQRELQSKAYRELSELERIAKEHGFSYVELDGDIGVMCNGAGLTMATMDIIKHYGGRPANFLDIGGGASRERVKEAMKILLGHPRARIVFVNIFGGITRCDEVAWGVVEALKETGANKPIVVRMLGTNEEEGRRILMEHGIHAYTDLREAVSKVVELSHRG